MDVLQLRDKQLADRELIDRARRLRRLTRGTATLLIIDDRPDLAALAQADGVHVGQEELCVKDAQSIVGAEMLIGVSTHSIEQARQAVLDGATYIGVGPTFPSGTKQFDHFPGLELLRQWPPRSACRPSPSAAYGKENVGPVRAAGFTRVAVSGAITGAEDPAQAAGEIKNALMTEI